MASLPNSIRGADFLGASSLFNISGLVGLITGGGSGIGLMMAKALAQNGAAKVYIAGRRLDVLQDAAASAGPNVIPLRCDVTCKSSLQEAATLVEQDAGYLNLLVCNAGIGGPQVQQISQETTIEDWASENFAVGYDDYLRTFSVNSAAVWYTSMAFLRLLDLGNEKGNMPYTSQIIVTGSIASFNKKAPGGWAYGQSKAAATLAVKQLAVVLPQWNVRANCIAPGLFPSEMSEPIVRAYSGGEGASSGGGGTGGASSARGASGSDSVVEEGGKEGAAMGGAMGAMGAIEAHRAPEVAIRVPASMVPMQRLGDEGDMAGTLLYLASRAGAYTNGAVIVVNGGRLGNFPAAF